MRRERRAANVQKMKRAYSNIEVYIDELVLHGFSAADRYSVGDALTIELKQLFETRESNLFLTRNVNIPTLNAGQVALPLNARPISVGAQVAQVVYESLNNRRGRQ